MKSLLLFLIFYRTSSGYLYQNPYFYGDRYENLPSRRYFSTYSIIKLFSGIDFENRQRIEQLQSSLQHLMPWRSERWENAQAETLSQAPDKDFSRETKILKFRTNEDDNKTWTHDDQTNWPIMYPQCVGKRQSPINIRARYFKENKSPTCLEWKNYKIPRPSMMTSLTKYTVEVSTDGPVPSLRGGPLAGSYIFNGIHFHWGYDQYDGSEHAINSRKSSLELHGVHFNSKFRNIAEAIDSGENEALVVVAILFQAARKSNFGIAAVVERVKRGFALNETISLSDFGFGFRNNYYSYLGSLTTPPCNEVVRWIISGNIQFIKYKELKVLRTLMVDDKPLLDNFRELQPINGRTIYHYNFC